MEYKIKAKCENCQRPYGDEHGFTDLIIPNWAWKQISPNGNLTGLLCPSCICEKLHEVGLKNVPASFMSGSIKSVDSTVMENLRWIENIKDKTL